MIKEIIISATIVIVIFIGNIITENYTRYAIEEISNRLLELRSLIEKDENDINNDIAIQKINEIYENWDLKYEKLAYYIEHDELEKVETELTGLRAYIEKEEYYEALPEIDKSAYILEHIKDKSALNLKNIF